MSTNKPFALRLADVAAYTRKGATRRGTGQPGAMDIPPAGLPAWVEARERNNLAWPPPDCSALAG